MSNETTRQSLVELNRIQQLLNRLTHQQRKAEERLTASRQKLSELRAMIKKQEQFEYTTHTQDAEKRSALEQQMRSIELRKKATAPMSNAKMRSQALRLIEQDEQRAKAELDALPPQKLPSDSSQLLVLRAGLIELETQAGKIQNDCEAEIETVEARQRELLAEQSQQRVGVDSRTLATFDRLLQQHPEAIARIEKESCSECSMLIPPQEVIKLRDRDELIRCRGCGRFLTIVAEKAATDT